MAQQATKPRGAPIGEYTNSDCRVKAGTEAHLTSIVG